MNDGERPSLPTWQPDPQTSYPASHFPLELEAAYNDVEAIRIDFAARAARRRAAHPAPGILYQYTDLTGLHGICLSGAIWLSDAAYMNDPLEGTWVHHRAREAAEKLLAKGTDIGLQCIDQIEAMLTPLPDLWLADWDALSEPRRAAAMNTAFLRAYIASFSTNGDLLSQWRGYGGSGSGVSVGVDLTDLSDTVFKDVFGSDVRPTLFRVEYDQKTQDQELEWLFASIQKTFDRHAPILEINPLVRPIFMGMFYYTLRDSLDIVRWEFKSPYYSEEQEWRICLSHPAFEGDRSRVSGNVIVPYVAMPLPQEDRRWKIREIILGPRCSESIAHGVRSVLAHRAIPKVRRSKLAFR